MKGVFPFSFLNAQGAPPPPPMLAYFQTTGNSTKALNLNNDSVSNFSTAYASGRYNCMQSSTAGYYESGWLSNGGVPQGTGSSNKTHSRFVFANQTETLIGAFPYSYELKHGTASTTTYGYIFSKQTTPTTLVRGQTVNYSNNTTNVIGSNLAVNEPNNSRLPYTSNATNSKSLYAGWSNSARVRIDVNNGSAFFINNGFTLVNLTTTDYQIINSMAINLANESRRYASPKNKFGSNSRIVFANNTEEAYTLNGNPSDGLTYRMTAYTSYAAWMGVDGTTNGRELSKWNLASNTNFSLISSPFNSAASLQSVIQDSDVE